MPCENCRTRDCHGGLSCPAEAGWALHAGPSPLVDPDGNRLPLDAADPPSVLPAALPAGVRGWSWGGFLLTWIWAFGNRHWTGPPALCIHILSIIAIAARFNAHDSWAVVAIPYSSGVLAIWLGLKGREMAWRSCQWEDLEHFERVQHRWTLAGIWTWVVLGALGAACLYLLAILAEGLSAMKG
jgi:hypothetical protein